MSLTYAIADLHGRFDLLTAAFEAIYKDAILRGATGEKFKIVTMGDYVDRGPQSRQIIEHLMAAQVAGAPVICLKGNHEDMMVETLRKPLDRDWWIGNGGGTTLRSYAGEVPDDHLGWVAELPRFYTDEHRVYVHAGVSDGIPLDEQTEMTLLWFRYPEGADVGYGSKHVVHGHTPHINGPQILPSRTNLDTLAWRTGRLVVAVFDDEVAGGPIYFIEIRGPSA